MLTCYFISQVILTTCFISDGIKTFFIPLTVCKSVLFPEIILSGSLETLYTTLKKILSIFRLKVLQFQFFSSCKTLLNPWAIHL